MSSNTNVLKTLKVVDLCCSRRLMPTENNGLATSLQNNQEKQEKSAETASRCQNKTLLYLRISLKKFLRCF